MRPLFYPLLAISFSHLVCAAPFDVISLRDTSTCAGDSSLSSCGPSFPSSFCCPASTTCIPINGTSEASVVCCPEGKDCGFLQPITCDITFQNATLHPASPLHSLNLTATLPTCGRGCCPLGYQCRNGGCMASVVSSSTSLTSQAPTTTAVANTASSAAASATTATSTTPVALPNESATSSPSAAANPSTSFSGKAFAAGFIPGILIGAIACSLLIYFCVRKRSARSKHNTMDFGPIGPPISEPIVHPSFSNRTDFHHSPPRTMARGSSTYEVSVSGPWSPTKSLRTPASARIKSLFHRSPTPTKESFSVSSRQDLDTTPTPRLTQLPVSLRRGSIMPIRGLRTKKSSHSLRREMRESKAKRPGPSRQGSQETIKILMSTTVSPYTPEHAKGRKAPTENYPLPQNGTAIVSDANSAGGGNGALGTPYTPSRYGAKGGGKMLAVDSPDVDDRRLTTMSGMMKRAGVSRTT